MAEKKDPKGKKKGGIGFGEMPKPLGYGAMKKAFATPGWQEGELAMARRIAHNRQLDTLKEAVAIGRRRTARGVSTAGVAGPKDMKVSAGKSRPPEKKDPAKGRGTNKPSGLGPGREKARATAPKVDRSLAIPKELLPKPKPPSPAKRTTSGGSRKAM